MKPKISSDRLAAAEQQIADQSRRIDFYITEYSIELLATKMGNGDFEVPAYQREFTWDDPRKSRFVESLLLGLPIPFLFFWERPDTGKLEVVDGSQRLRTIESFLLRDFVLGELEKLDEVSGFRFQDLSESRQRKLKNRSIRGIILNEHADEAARFDLFERINTGSMIANKAEIRRGALGGGFMDMVISLARDSIFEQLAPVPAKQVAEREREELVARFFAYGDGLAEYKDRVSDFLYFYTKKMNTTFSGNPSIESEYRNRFRRVLEFVETGFPAGFRKGKNGTATPRARFEAIAVGSWLALRENQTLVVAPGSVETWLDSKEFREVTGSDGANAKSRLEKRIHFVRDKLLGVGS
jgi:hypothetical protein